MQKNKIEFNGGTHQYFVNGNEFISVTDVFKRAGIDHLKDVPRNVTGPAKERGSTVHEIAKLYALRKLDDNSVDPALLGYFNAVVDFFKREVKKIIAVEERVASVTMGYAGTLDLVYLNAKRECVLVDYKTAREETATARLQTAAYACAWEKMNRKKIHLRGTVHLTPLGSYVFEEHKNPIRRDFGDFVTMLKFAKLKQNMKLK